MATSTRPTNRRENRPTSPPDWSAEALVAHRPVWEIAAMAGNVAPKLTLVKAKKDADPEWREGYEQIVRLMTNALSSNREKLPNHVYYELHRSGNGALIRNLSNLRKVRVEVASAIEFLWNVYGVGATPDGFKVVHQHLRSQDSGFIKEATAVVQKQSSVDSEQSAAAKKASYRDQRLANATKEVNRLRTLVYALARDMCGVSPDSKYPPPTLIKDVLAALKTSGFEGCEGLGIGGVQSLLDQCFNHVFKSPN